MWCGITDDWFLAPFLLSRRQWIPAAEITKFARWLRRFALLNGADPSPVKVIDYLKDRLAKG